MNDDDKKTAAEAGLRPAECCHNCKYFVGEGQPCEKVSDPTYEDDTCDLFEDGNR